MLLLLPWLCSASSIAPFAQDCFDYSRSFRIAFPSSVKNVVEILMGIDCSESVDHFQ
jgi:hypothetical protein